MEAQGQQNPETYNAGDAESDKSSPRLPVSPSPRLINLALLGFGNLGRAFAEHLAQRHDRIKRNFGVQLRLVGAVDSTSVVINREGLDGGALARLKVSGKTLASSAGAGAVAPGELIQRLAEAGAHIIVETLPSSLRNQGEPAVTLVSEALARGLHVVTANKAVLLFAGRRLERLASDRGVRLAHSGATCAALPTLSFARRELVGARIEEIRGILNGTTNYILTRMNEEGLSFEAALAEAQAAGIAEPDPRYDIEGWDSAAKLLILANALMGAEAGFEQVSRCGIDAIPRRLSEDARAVNGALKLVATARRAGHGVELSVAPKVVLPADGLFAVRGSNKAVEFRTDLYGTLLLAGGASSRTAVAATLLKDVIQVLSDGRCL
jgi:homoserine dehydrogenase